jgi:hypothetical protein
MVRIANARGPGGPCLDPQGPRHPEYHFADGARFNEQRRATEGEQVADTLARNLR